VCSEANLKVFSRRAASGDGRKRCQSRKKIDFEIVSVRRRAVESGKLHISYVVLVAARAASGESRLAARSAAIHRSLRRSRSRWPRAVRTQLKSIPSQDKACENMTPTTDWLHIDQVSETTTMR